jgi:DNA polymerase-3 subunit gamma/tau
MLGSIDQGVVYALLDALAALDGAALLAAVAAIAEQATDFSAVLEELLSALHRIAIAQAVPDALDNSQGDRERILDYATKLAGEDVQLFYQIALHGRRDLPLASDPRAGLEMTLLRMLAFKPQGVPQPPREKLGTRSGGGNDERAASQRASANTSAPAPTMNAAPSVSAAPVNETVSVKKPEAVAASVTANVNTASPRLQSIAPVERPALETAPSATVSAKPILSVVPSAKPNTPQAPAAAAITLANFDNALWSTRFTEFGIGGVVGTIASHCCLAECSGDQLRFVLDEKHSSFFDAAHTQRITDQLNRVFDTTLRVQITIGLPQLEIEADPNVQLLQAEFGALLDINSIKPLDSD